MVMKQRALFLVNRQARRGSQNIDFAVQQLRRSGFELIEPMIEDSSQISNAIVAHQGLVDLVIVGGGDGTLNGAVRGLVETQLPLGILPLGTANDLARTLGIPSNVNLACQVIAGREMKRIDLGSVNGHYFFNVASFGLSVEITERLTREAKRRWGVFAYAVAALQAIGASRPFTAIIRSQAGEEKVKTIQVSVGNGLYYGGGLAVAHDASIEDERLDLYSLEIAHFWKWVKLLPAMYKGRHHLYPYVYAQEGREFWVETKRSFSINTDGELTTQTPAHFKVVPQAIAVIVPSA
jgi:diacylglycerol kinase (ATP)